MRKFLGIVLIFLILTFVCVNNVFADDIAPLTNYVKVISKQGADYYTIINNKNGDIGKLIYAGKFNYGDEILEIRETTFEDVDYYMVYKDEKSYLVKKADVSELNSNNENEINDTYANIYVIAAIMFVIISVIVFFKIKK